MWPPFEGDRGLMVQRLSRRRFLLTAGGAASGVALATACQSQAVPVPTGAPAKPAAGAPAATTAPVGAAPAGAAPAATAAPAAPAATTAPAAAQASSGAINRKETLIFSVSDDLNQFADPTLFNPFLTGTKRTGWHFAYEPLYFYNPWFSPEVTAPPGLTGKDGETPYLATSYQYSPDYTDL